MDELLSEFLTETSESVSELDVELVQLEQNPNDQALLSNIFRLVHTIKGTCGFLGLPRLEAVAHAAENVLGRIRDGSLEVTPDAITLILESFDRIKWLLSSLEENEVEPEGDDQDLIDRLNILHASLLAMTRAVAGLRTPPDHALIDGNFLPKGLCCPATPLIKGDGLSLSIAAASIVAKTSRDRAMCALAQQYPGYGWERNAGYPTPLHRQALQDLGVTPHHRRSFKPVHNILYQASSATS